MVRRGARKKPADDTALKPPNGEAAPGMPASDPAEFWLEVVAIMTRLGRRGTFDFAMYDYLFDENRPGPTLEEVEQIPYEDMTADLPEWPGRKFPTAQS